MIKGKKTLLTGGAIILVGLAAFIGYPKIVEFYTTVKVQEHVEKVYNLKDVTRVEYKAGDLITLEKQGTTWVNPELPNLSYNQELMTEWIENLQNLETKEIVKNVQDQSVYGINENSIMITLYDSMNNCETIQVGDIIEEENSVYIKCDSDNVLYTLSYDASQEIFTRPNDFVDCSKVLEIPEIQSIGIESTSDHIQMVKDKSWYLKDYYAIPGFLKEEDMEKLISTISSIKIKSYIGTYDDLTAYGLENPSYTLTLNESEKIAFGNVRGDSVYVRVNHSQDVYTLDQSVYISIASFNPYDAMDKQVIHLEMDQIDTITLVNPQGNYQLKFKDNNEMNTQTELNSDKIENKEAIATSDEEIEENSEVALSQNQTSEQAEQNQEETSKATDETTKIDEESQEVIVATLNEIGLNANEAQAWLDKIEESLCIQAPLQNPNIEQKEERKAEATITYQLKDGSICEIELIPYDINYYILRYNGKIEFAVNKEKVIKVFNELTNFTKK